MSGKIEVIIGDRLADPSLEEDDHIKPCKDSLMKIIRVIVTGNKYMLHGFFGDVYRSEQ